MLFKPLEIKIGTILTVKLAHNCIYFSKLYYYYKYSINISNTIILSSSYKVLKYSKLLKYYWFSKNISEIS